MAFRAVHAQWGTVFAHLPDLGCGQAWEAVWKVRPARAADLRRVRPPDAREGLPQWPAVLRPRPGRP